MSNFLDLIVCSCLGPHMGWLLLLHVELFALTLLHLHLIRKISSVSTLNLLSRISSRRLTNVLLKFLLCSSDSVWDRTYAIAIVNLIYGFCLHIILGQRRNSIKMACWRGLSMALADLLVCAILSRFKILTGAL
jgi:hypothetical protein